MTYVTRNRALCVCSTLVFALALAATVGCGKKSDTSENESGGPPRDSMEPDSGSSVGDGRDGEGGDTAHAGEMDAGRFPSTRRDGGSEPDEAAEPEDSGLGPEGGRMGPDGAVQVREKPESGCLRLERNESNYWYCSDPLPPSLAAGACWAAGGTLVVINDADEDLWIVSQLFEDDEEIVIGYTDAGGEGDWVWADGTRGGYENWDEAQPGLDDFAILKRSDGLWFTSVDDPRPYICEDWK